MHQWVLFFADSWFFMLCDLTRISTVGKKKNSASHLRCTPRDQELLPVVKVWMVCPQRLIYDTHWKTAPEAQIGLGHWIMIADAAAYGFSVQELQVSIIIRCSKIKRNHATFFFASFQLFYKLGTSQYYIPNRENRKFVDDSLAMPK